MAKRKRRRRTKRKAERKTLEPRIRVAISKTLKWIEPYLRRAKKRMPSLVLPSRVRSYCPTPRKEQQSWGSCDFESRSITICTHKIIIMRGMKRSTKKLVALSNKEILMTLAHEIAHLRHHKHGYEQESFARTIFHAMGVTDTCPLCNGKGEVPAEYKND